MSMKKTKIFVGTSINIAIPKKKKTAKFKWTEKLLSICVGALKYLEYEWTRGVCCVWN